MADPAETGPRRRSSRSTRATAGCSRWSAATSFSKSQFNLAVQGERQPGSSFKPFVLATALPQGISPETTFESKPQVIDLGDKLWAVRNYEDAYLGRVEPRDGDDLLGQHRLRAADALRRPEERSPRRRTGSASGARSTDYFAIGLGAEAVNPLEMARAFSTFANGGAASRRRALRQPARGRCSRVRGRRKRLDTQRARRERPVLDANRRRSSTRSSRRSCSYGTGKRAALDGRPVAGKTGTTENYGDAWFVGYTPQLAVAVWVGLPGPAPADADGVRRRGRRGRHVPRADLEVVHEAALDRSTSRPSASRRRRPVRGADARRPAAAGGWMLDNGHCRDTRDVVFFAGSGPDEDGRLQAERGRGAERRRSDGRRRNRRASLASR